MISRINFDVKRGSFTSQLKHSDIDNPTTEYRFHYNVETYPDWFVLIRTFFGEI